MSFKAEEAKETVENYLNRRKELSHLKVGARGELLTITSEDEQGNIYPHARLRRRSVHKWNLEMPIRRGWESTFMEGTYLELMELLLEKFPWTLTSR